MKFDLTNKSTEELLERQELLAVEIPQETRDAMTEDEIEERADELAAIKAELEARKEAAAEMEQRAEEVAQQSGEPIIETEERNMYDINTAEYRDLWIRNLQGSLNDEEKRAYSASSTNAVPTLVADKFFEKMKKLAPMLSEITLLRVAGNIKFVSEGTRGAADAKHTENSANNPAADTTVYVQLGGFEFLKIIQISRTAKLMAIEAFEGWLVDMLAGDIARAIDNYIINDETNGIAALTWTSNTNQIVAASPAYADICNLIALLPAAYDAEAKFLANKKTLYTKVASIVDSAGNPIFVPDTVNGIGGRLMGYPVVVDDYVASDNGSLYLGRWTDVVGNLSEDIHVDVDESAGFTANSIMYRGVAVFDSKPAKGDGIVRLVTTTA
jgi:HK97 family phage major capsid protein